MGEMVRKQIYIRKQQDESLKRISEARGQSEAEIVRQRLVPFATMLTMKLRNLYNG